MNKTRFNSTCAKILKNNALISKVGRDNDNLIKQLEIALKRSKSKESDHFKVLRMTYDRLVFNADKFKRLYGEENIKKVSKKSKVNYLKVSKI